LGLALEIQVINLKNFSDLAFDKSGFWLWPPMEQQQTAVVFSSRTSNFVTKQTHHFGQVENEWILLIKLSKTIL
jgi:hypothetical protein